MTGLISKTWDFINGKKTTLGAVAYFTGKVLVSSGIVVGELLVEAGNFVMGFGLLHKGQKEYRERAARKNGNS